MRSLMIMGAAFAFIGVGLGAFGAHALSARIEESRIKTYQTGVQYHLIHALAILLVAALEPAHPGAGAAAWLFGGGIVLFSGSLYGLAVGKLRGRWGVVTPIGGLFFLSGWLVLGMSAWH